MNNESNKHQELKEKAKQFLESMGCKDIQFEYRLPKIQFSLGEKLRHWNTKQFFIFDVAGFKDGRLVAVECGGTLPRKLSSLHNQAILLYIFPHGKIKPYLWHNGIQVCDRCGNKT